MNFKDHELTDSMRIFQWGLASANRLLEPLEFRLNGSIRETAQLYMLTTCG